MFNILENYIELILAELKDLYCKNWLTINKNKNYQHKFSGFLINHKSTHIYKVLKTFPIHIPKIRGMDQTYNYHQILCLLIMICTSPVHAVRMLTQLSRIYILVNIDTQTLSGKGGNLHFQQECVFIYIYPTIEEGKKPHGSLLKTYFSK